MIRPQKQWGYCRVSRPKQNLDRQVRNIKSRYPNAEILKEIHTRTKFDGRTVWQKLMKQIQPGDVIIFDSVSRMSGNAEEGVEAYMELYNRGVELVFLNEEHINTSVYKAALNNQVPMTGTNVDSILEGVNKFLMALAAAQIKIAFEQSEKEVEDLRQRTIGGIETARQNGKQIGRVQGRKYETEKSRKYKERILKMSKTFGGNMTDQECLDTLQIARNTFYKYKRELMAEGSVMNQK